MIRLALTIVSIACLTLSAFGAEHGGAIPTGLSFYESTEFPDVQWSTSRDTGAEATWGQLVLEGTKGVHFVPDSGSDVVVPYTAISGIKYERVVVKKEKTKDSKWHQRAFAFAKGVDTYRVVTIEHNSNMGSRQVAVIRVDEESYASIVRMLEIKTGLRAKKLSSF